MPISSGQNAVLGLTWQAPLLGGGVGRFESKIESIDRIEFTPFLLGGGSIESNSPLSS
jgi:hypothetical protein